MPGRFTWPPTAIRACGISLVEARKSRPSGRPNQLRSRPGGRNRTCNVVLVLDGTATPEIAWYEIKEEGEGRRMMAWRPGHQPAIAMETKAATDFPNLSLAS